MTTLQQKTLARLRAEAEQRMREQTRIAEQWRAEQERRNRRSSDIASAGDFVVGLLSGIGLSALIVFVLWQAF